MTIKEEIAALEERMKKSYTGADIARLNALRKSLTEEPHIEVSEKPAPEKKAVKKTARKKKK
mgnify:CR=1 FL=1